MQSLQDILRVALTPPHAYGTLFPEFLFTHNLLWVFVAS
jgi:hypothetical protein